MQPIFLIGYMGSGKSTLGFTLSRLTGLDFIDIDTFIENRYHKSISQLFADHGEQWFRNVERNVLHELGEFENVIIACGGGTPCHLGNMDFMLAHGNVVWLDASVDSIFLRLAIPSARRKRPLIANMDDAQLRSFIIEALASRQPFYSRANIHFDASRLESRDQIDQSTAELASILGLKPL
ncbi:MAG: shikimate kinase [Muribaculaceae bacterium]|nr:shikimate kinase [Muribaculaceae bacterium]MDY3933683.1 shikimate kinase [Muribaculaceae bacterium]